MEEHAPVVTNQQCNHRPWLSIFEQKQLLSRYPLFFRAVNHPNAYPSNIAHFGLQCGVGWYDIVEELAREVEHELRAMWQELIEFPLSLALLDETLLLGRCDYPVVPVCTNISQLSGAMVIDVTEGHVCGIGTWERIRGLIEGAVSKSRETCESCGDQGEYRAHWRHVYCDRCIAPNSDQDDEGDSSVRANELNGCDASARRAATIKA